MMKFFMPRAAPYAISPTAAALASLVSETGMPSSASESSLENGTEWLAAHTILGAKAISPV